MTWILAYFGYIKVPKEAILMCMSIEDYVKAMIIVSEKPAFAEHFKVCLRTIQTLTHFLRCGKLLSNV